MENNKRSILDVLSEVLVEVECSQCYKAESTLYDLEGEIWCRDCLASTAWLEEEQS